ncbi:HNH endonuclease [Propionibacteriaceae bacterium Y1685]|uniref:HNH endonuclease n=1 Tax=Microlunatus sp. Y1700 TaxID=3418487 RepID=UPI003B78AE5C
MSGVVVLNTDNTALHTVSIPHAIRMLIRQVAIIEEALEDRQIGPYPVPLVLRLVRYVKTAFLYGRTPAWSKRSVLRRDQHICAFCGGHGTTIDHVVPTSRGGRNTWLNTVCACETCNRRKADRTPAEAAMPLRFAPRVPLWREVTPRP